MVYCVFIRFRLDPGAFMVDITQIFHSFIVDERHRDLRLFWHRDNATYGCRKAAEVGNSAFGSDVKELVDKNFFVDDALKSVVTPAKAIHALERACVMLAPANLRLYKIVSSYPKVT